ncbi:MAG TPA: GtrA family protein, partial [Patescibacteria group bacterium]
ILLSCIKTRWYEEFTQKFLKFGVVGGVGFVINTVVGRLFKNALTHPDSNISFVNFISNAMAAELSIISNFTFNNLWTFSKEKISNVADLLPKFVTFNLSSLVTGILIPSIVIGVLTSVFGDHFFVYQVIAIFGLTIPLNWFVYNKFIWKKK